MKPLITYPDCLFVLNRTPKVIILWQTVGFLIFFKKKRGKEKSKILLNINIFIFRIKMSLGIEANV